MCKIRSPTGRKLVVGQSDWGIKHDILMALDKTSGVFLALINISAAFDTVVHDILLNFLQ